MLQNGIYDNKRGKRLLIIFSGENSITFFQCRTVLFLILPSNYKGA